jgi:hypothetical protein
VTGESSFDLPTEATLPDGWTVAHDPATDAIEFINQVRQTGGYQSWQLGTRPPTWPGAARALAMVTQYDVLN